MNKKNPFYCIPFFSFSGKSFSKKVFNTTLTSLITPLIGAVLSPSTSDAASIPHTYRALAHQASRSTQVPEGLLLAIASIESRFCPYAINVRYRGAGDEKTRTYSACCPSPQAASTLVRQWHNRGARNISVGLMQVHLGSHALDLKNAFSPAANMLYAARMLAKLKKRYPKHSWMQIAMAYHKGHMSNATAYRMRVQREMAKLKISM